MGRQNLVSNMVCWHYFFKSSIFPVIWRFPKKMSCCPLVEFELSFWFVCAGLCHAPKCLLWLTSYVYNYWRSSQSNSKNRNPKKMYISREVGQFSHKLLCVFMYKKTKVSDRIAKFSSKHQHFPQMRFPNSQFFFPSRVRTCWILLEVLLHQFDWN